MEIETIKPYKSVNLEVGDIIFGEDNFINGAYKSRNRDIVEVGFADEESCEKVISYVDTMYSKGKLFQNNRTSNLKSIDEGRKSGIWVVDEVIHRKKFKGLHGIIPELLTIRAIRLKDNTYDENSEVIEFHTIGSNNTIDIKFEIIGKLKEF